VQKLRERLVHQLAAERDGDPRRLINTYFHAFQFGRHPYGRPVSGTETTLATLTRDDVLGYYRGNVAPDRLILAFAGDVDGTVLAAKVDAAFFAGTMWRSNFLCSLGYGDPSALRERLPRFDFDEVCTFA